MIDDEVFYVAHDLCIALVGVGRDGLQALAVLLVDRGGLGMQDKGDRQQALRCLVAVPQNKIPRRTLIHSISTHVRRLSFPQSQGRLLTS